MGNETEKRHKRGRIPYEYYGIEAADRRIDCRITESEYKDLEYIANYFKCSKSKAIRLLIQGSKEYINDLSERTNDVAMLRNK